MVALTKELGPDGRPKLLPGDFIMNGGNGEAGHLTIYAGEDPKTGEPQIIHAMATAITQQSVTQFVANVGEATVEDVVGLGEAVVNLVRKPKTSDGELRAEEKMGVFREGLAEFFDRFHRDTVVVVRDPKLTDDMRRALLEAASRLVGKQYDYDFRRDNDAYYCTEVGIESLRGAYAESNLALPWVGTTPVDTWPVHDFVVKTENFMASPSFVVTHANGTGVKARQAVLDTYVSGAPNTERR
jgi:hypothetical protein